MLKEADISTLLLFSLSSGSRTTLLDSHRELHPSFFIKLLVTPSKGSPQHQFINAFPVGGYLKGVLFWTIGSRSTDWSVFYAL